MSRLTINTKRLLSRLATLGEIGSGPHGGRTRLAGSQEDAAARRQLAEWARDAGLEVATDRIGNQHLIARGHRPPVEGVLMIGSHIDTVIEAGAYDGVYGVLTGLEILQSLVEQGTNLPVSLCVTAFTNEEGVRFQPDMMGSLVYAGGLALEDALAERDSEGVSLGEALAGIGAAGDCAPGFLPVKAYLELHIEQGPVLEHDGLAIGVVDSLQGISWQRVCFAGRANHAGTTPMALRQDAGLAAARAHVLAAEIARNHGGVATVGTVAFSPSAINVIAGQAQITLDLRHPDEARLQAMEADFAQGVAAIALDLNVTVERERLARFEPVRFDERLAQRIEKAARQRGLSHRRMTSGAGHDAQMIARIAPSAMIFVPSRDGISHNPLEFTSEDQLIAGAHCLLDVTAGLLEEWRT